MTLLRRRVLFHQDAQSWLAPPAKDSQLAWNFHQSLPGYQVSPLVSLENIAKEVGVGRVLVKDESNRLNLPSFKILGASWGTFRAVCHKLSLGPDTTMETLKTALKKNRVVLYAATDGNHGRAVGRMGQILGIAAKIYVPDNMSQSTIKLIESEGAQVIKPKGSYDDAIATVDEAAKGDPDGLLVQDTAFEGYEEIPTWIVEGYRTLMQEVDNQLGDRKADLVICPVGVGSLAQAVVSHLKQEGKATAMMTVEPDTAACLWTSLSKGEFTSLQTSPTIMAGLDCGTVSTTAWPLLQNGVDASSTVSDYEAHVATVELHHLGISAGPCGASSLAALRRLSHSDKQRLGLTETSTVVLLCTEAKREYSVPFDPSIEDPVALTQILVQINSANPEMGSVQGPGEGEIARYIKQWLEHRDIENHWIEPIPGRPSIVGVVRGSGGGKSLMFNGHTDTVTNQGYDGNPLSGEIKDGKLYGRGSADMKCGVAAALVALANTKTLGLRGDVLVAGVADEELMSIGTQQILEAGWRADAAIVNEPVNLKIGHAHKGFVQADVTIHGVASHGSRPDLGVDAICKAGYFLVELDRYGKELEKYVDPTLGPGSVHASIIQGGEEASSYPAQCIITLERRTITGETVEKVERELRDLLEKIAHHDPQFKYDLHVTLHRSSFSLPADHPFSSLLGRHVAKATGKEASFEGLAFWTDAALLSDAGIPTLVWGPTGEGLHAKEEWVDVESIKTVAEALTTVAAEFCQ